MQKNVYYSFKSRAKMEKKIPIAANYIFTKELKEKVEALEGIKGDKLVFKLNGSIVFLSVLLFVFFSQSHSFS